MTQCVGKGWRADSQLSDRGSGREFRFTVIPGHSRRTIWTEAAFDRLRADGAFLVSAVRHAGRTAWVRVESLAGAPCRLVVADWDSTVVREHTGPLPRVSKGTAGDYVIELRRGASVVLAPDATTPLPELRPVTLPVSGPNPFPMRKHGPGASQP